MSPREGLVLFLTGAAALAAALSYRVATAPAEIHDPVHARAFEDVCAALPVAGAVRVRSAAPRAAHRIATAPGAAKVEVVDPRRAAATFRYGRLLFAAPGEVDAVLDRLEHRLSPGPLPRTPDVARYFRDNLGPYACDVIVSDADGLALVRRVVPDALLYGEPVARADEESRAGNVTRALIAGLAVVWAWVALRRGAADAERRLLAALVPLALLGVLGWGVDPWTVPALIVVAAAPRGLPLLGAAPCLLFPSLALRRIGLVLVAGACARGLERPAPPAAELRWPLLLLALLPAALWWPLERALAPPRLPEAVRHEAAIALVPRDRLADEARRLREQGHAVAGDERLAPARPDLPARRKLRRIYQLATERALAAAGAERDRFDALARAAAVEEIHLPRDLRRRLFADDGRAALWVHGPLPLDQPDLTGAALHRARGERELKRQALLAGLLTLLAGGAALCAWRGRRATGPLLVRAAGVVAAFALLVVADRFASPAAAETLLPVAATASLAPSWLVVPGLAAAVVFLPPLYHLPALAIIAATLLAFSRR